jgi:PAS domain S-box-containing protein
MMDASLERTIADHETEILDRWTARLANTGLTGEADARAALRALLAEVREELRRSPPKAMRIPLRPACAEPVPSATQPGIRPNILLALALGPDAVRESLSSAGEASRVSEAFRRVFDRHGESACARCRADQDRTRMDVEDRLRTAIEHARDAILTCDTNGAITAWNRGAEELFRLPAAAIEGRSLASLVLVEQPDAWARTLVRNVRESGHVRIAELELVTGEDGRIWADASFSRMRGPEGEDTGVWAVFRDITEQRRLLQQSLDAERLALVGTMSAKFAHEIRNPLASIQLNVELIGDALRARPSPSGEDDEGLVRAIASEVQRIRNVVQEYLRFGRLPTVHRGAVDLDAELARRLSILAPEVASRGIRLVPDLAAPGRLVLADADQVWQAIHNLVANAMDAGSRGGRIRVATRALPAALRVEIEDDGPGIPAAIRDKVFAPFFSTKKAGTGLGLPFTRQVLAEHGATLALESSEAGTRFSFDLPYASGEVS